MSKLNSRLQTAEIEFNRQALAIRPVELNDLLSWWTQRVCWATRGWGRSDAFDGMQALESNMPIRLFDHWGSAVDETGQPVFVTEPYQRYDDSNAWGVAAAIAEALGLHFRVLPADCSWWFPGNTIRIEFAECVHQPTCRRCNSRERMRDESRAAKRLRQRGATCQP